MKRNMEKDRGTQSKSSKQCTSTTCTCSHQQEEKGLAKTIRDKLHLKLPKKLIEEVIILWYVRNFNKMPPQWLANWKDAPDSILIGVMNERQIEKDKEKHCKCFKSAGN